MSQYDGLFLWYDLMTEDVDGAKAFYSEVIGWKTQPFSDDYTVLLAGEQSVGGVMKLPAEAKAMGAPPHWMAMVGVSDVDATEKRVVELGGKVYKSATDIPTVGRIAVFADPQGAVIGVFCPEVEMTSAHDEPSPGHFAWNELMTTDSDGAWAFYSELFGWAKTDAVEMGEISTYQMYGVGDRTVGGLMTKTEDMAEMPSMWLYYTTVDAIDPALERVKNNGGQILNGPMEVPGGDRVANCIDPQGAMFSLHEIGPK